MSEKFWPMQSLMMDKQVTPSNIMMNMLGTAYNVLSENDHPDTEEFANVLRGFVNSMAGSKGPMFDLRSRRINGEVYDDSKNL
jgi:hypothetical protein